MKKLTTAIAVAAVLGLAGSQIAIDTPTSTIAKRDGKIGSTITVADVTSGTVTHTAVAESVAAADYRVDSYGPYLQEAANLRASDKGAERSEDPVQVARDKMSNQVLTLADMGGSQLVDLVVSYDTHPELFEDERVRELGGEVVRAYKTLDMRALRVPADALIDFAIDDNVDRVSLDEIVTVASDAARKTANLPEASSANSAYTGLGVNVAIIDTGVSKHADIDATVKQYDFLNGAYPEPAFYDDEIESYNFDPRKDDYGHGTHVAGVVAGLGSGSGNAHRGGAQGSKLLSMRVLDASGTGTASDTIGAIDWLLTYAETFDIRVVNMSLGKRVSESNTTDPLVQAVEELWDSGVVVVAAAGNLGRNGHFTVKSPGNSRKIITVGSLTDKGTGNDFSDDFVSSFSSRGPTPGDNVLKPDLVAPGNKVVAAIPENAHLRDQLPNRVVPCDQSGCEDDYMRLSGTSMATPLVAATVALMLEKDPTLNPATVKARLMRSARKMDGVDPTEIGSGVLDIDAAMNETGTVMGDALSPLMIRDEVTDGIMVEDTASLWGNATWAAGYLWSDGYLWADNAMAADGYLWSDGYLWADGYLWSDGYLWADGYLWSDSYTDDDPLYDGTQASSFQLDDDE